MYLRRANLLWQPIKNIFAHHTFLPRNLISQIRSCSVQQKVLDLEKKVDQNDLSHEIVTNYRQVMSNVPQPVVVVTTALYDENNDKVIKRGITCASFTSVSLDPPIVSFCMSKPSRMHTILIEMKKFAIHILGKNQMKYGVHFSQPAKDFKCQFDQIPHTMSPEHLPVIHDANAILHCKAHSVHTVGDHHVWYGEVIDCQTCDNITEPLLYFARAYRVVGDEIFMKAFEDQTLPYEEWNHDAHLRMAWNYIRKHGQDKATNLIKNGIKKFNELNKDKITHGYNETVTMFFIHMLSEAIDRSDEPDMTFEQFLELNPEIAQKETLLTYYTPQVLWSDAAKERYILPDKKKLP